MFLCLRVPKLYTLHMQEEVLLVFPPIQQPILIEGANRNLLEPTFIRHSAMLLEGNRDPWAAPPTHSTGHSPGTHSMHKDLEITSSDNTEFSVPL